MKRSSIQRKLQDFRQSFKRVWPLLVVASVASLILLFLYREPLLDELADLYDLLTERERFTQYVASFGAAAPLVFMGIQVLQVVLAPIPGEFTGVIGGVLFGAYKGCLYSSLALTLGSLINFGIGRFWESVGYASLFRLIDLSDLITLFAIRACWWSLFFF